MPHIIQEIGAAAGLAAVVGLAVLSALYFSQARDVKRLREWAGRAPERAADQASQQAVVAQPQRSGAVQPIPGRVTPAPSSPLAAAAGGRPAAATPAGQNRPPEAAPVPQPAEVVAAGKGAAAAAAAAAQAAAAPAKPAEGATAAPAQPGDGAPAKVGDGASPAKPADGAPVKPAEATPGKPATATPGKPAQATPGKPVEAAAAQAGAAPAEAKAAAGATAKPATPAAAQGSAAAPAKPSAPAKPGAPATPAGARPAGKPAPRAGSGTPAIPSRPAAARPSSSPSQTAILPPHEEARRSWFRRISPRYLVLLVAGVLITGGAAAFALTQLAQEEAPAPKASRTERFKQSGGGKKKASAPAIVASHVTVSVLNGTTVPGLAAKVGDKVDALGFQLGNVTNNSDQSRNESVVLYAPGHEREAAAVARKLGISQREPIDAASQSLAGDAGVVVIAGTDQT